MEVKETKGGKRREARRGREGENGSGPDQVREEIDAHATPDTYRYSKVR